MVKLVQGTGLYEFGSKVALVFMKQIVVVQQQADNNQNSQAYPKQLHLFQRLEEQHKRGS